MQNGIPHVSPVDLVHIVGLPVVVVLPIVVWPAIVALPIVVLPVVIQPIVIMLPPVVVLPVVVLPIVVLPIAVLPIVVLPVVVLRVVVLQVVALPIVRSPIVVLPKFTVTKTKIGWNHCCSRKRIFARRIRSGSAITKMFRASARAKMAMDAVGWGSYWDHLVMQMPGRKYKAAYGDKGSCGCTMHWIRGSSTYA